MDEYFDELVAWLNDYAVQLRSQGDTKEAKLCEGYAGNLNKVREYEKNNHLPGDVQARMISISMIAQVFTTEKNS